MSEANGELLAFLDQDDIQLPKKTALQVAMLAAHPDAGMALCHKQYRIEGAPPAWFRGPTDGTAVPGFVPSCWLVRRETFERVGGFSPKFVTGCDYDWLARAKDLGITWATVPDVLVHYRVHGENESRHAATVKHDIVTYLRESLQRRRERAE